MYTTRYRKFELESSKIGWKTNGSALTRPDTVTGVWSVDEFEVAKSYFVDELRFVFEVDVEPTKVQKESVKQQ